MASLPLPTTIRLQVTLALAPTAPPLSQPWGLAVVFVSSHGKTSDGLGLRMGWVEPMSSLSGLVERIPAPPLGCIPHIPRGWWKTVLSTAHTVSLCFCLALGLAPVTPPSRPGVSSLDL